MKTENLSKIALLGIKDHLAVHQLGGRIGAALGPDAFRKSFSRMKSQWTIQNETVIDLGDVIPVSQEIPKNHAIAVEKIKTLHQNYANSLIIGGSHDHGYTHLKGIHEAHPKARLGCINIDAHLDVREPQPEITSGSPFYLAIENRVIDPKNFIEFGIQRHCNSADLWKFIKKHSIQIVPMENLRTQAVEKFQESLESLSQKVDQVVISFDLDAIASAYAPGVSAPQAEGLSASEAIQIAEICGKNPKVISLGIFELNPIHDSDQKTQLLAATLGYHYALEYLSR